MTYLQSYKKEEIEKKYFDWDLLKKLWVYLRAYRWMLGIAVILLLLAKGAEAAVPLLLGRMTRIMLGETAVEGAPFDAIIRSSIWVILLLIGSYALDAVNVVVKSWIGQRAIFKLRNKVYDHILHLPLSYYDKNAVGRLMTRTIHDIDQLNQMFSENIVPMIGNVFLIIGIFCGIVILDWRVLLVTLLLFPLILWHVNYFRKNQRRCYDLIRGIVSAMNTFVQEHLMGAATIRRFGLQERERARFDAINQDHATAYKETIHYFAFFYAGIDLLSSLSLIAVFTVLVAFAPVGVGFQAGTYFTFSLYTLMLFRPLAEMAERYNELQSAMASAERVFDVLDRRSEPAGGDLELQSIETVAFRDVWFAYEGENWILKGLSFSINKGESVALVGPTGAGKTSIMSLLLRFYPYQKGSIEINGKPIEAYSVPSLRKQFGVVLQDPVIFSATLEENISFDDPSIDVDSVVRQLGIAHLPRDLRGKRSELSVGEMQLVAMARALAHHRGFFMLDEATANIDSATERVIQEALKVLIHESTSLVIAHRLSTIKDVKRILVLSRGSLVEEGSHEELIAQNGLYEKLYRLQFLD